MYLFTHGHIPALFSLFTEHLKSIPVCITAFSLQKNLGYNNFKTCKTSFLLQNTL